MRKSAPPTPALTAVVIGTGRISEEHLTFLSSRADVRVAGVCDLSPSLAAYASERFAPASRPFTDYTAMLAETRPDVVHVLTPPGTHVRIVGDSLQAGAHVIVEKPVAPTHSEFLSLYEQAKSKHRHLVEDHNYRFNEPVLAIEKLVANGTLGDVREIDIRMALAIRKSGNRYADPYLPHPSHQLPAGVIHEFLTHLCYLAQRFMPAEQQPRIAAAWSKHGKEPHFQYDDLDALIIDGSVHTRIRFTSHSSPDAFGITVRGTRGSAEADLFQRYVRTIIPRRGGSHLSPLLNHLMNGMSLAGAGVRGFKNKMMQKTPYEGLRTFLAKTYDAIGSGAQPPVTFSDMDRASRLVEQLLNARYRI